MKPNFKDLSPKVRSTFGDGCGLSIKFLRVPQFIFTASCRHHDFNYMRGGGVLCKLKADWDFYTHMIDDSYKWWHYVVATIYYIGVTFIPISWFAFTYGRARSVEEILEKDKEHKLKYGIF